MEANDGQLFRQAGVGRKNAADESTARNAKTTQRVAARQLTTSLNVMRANMGLFAAILCFSTGCHYQAPGSPEHFPTTRLEGRITIGGQPIEKGWVTLFPTAGALGQPVIIPIQHDGNYSTDKAAVGANSVRVTLPASHIAEIKNLQPSVSSKLEALGGIRSPLRVKTAADQVNHFDVDLALVPTTTP